MLLYTHIIPEIITNVVTAASVDTETEREIQVAVVELAKSRTVVAIATVFPPSRARI